MLDNISDNIKSYFSSADLPGHYFTLPIRSHYNFFAKKIKKSSNWQGKLLWSTAQIITGAITSPILLGSLGIGAFLNIKPSLEILKHNQEEQDHCIRNIKIQHSMAKEGQVEDCAREVHKPPNGYSYKIVKSHVDLPNESDSFDENSENLFREEIQSMMKVNGIFSRHYLLSNIVDNNLNHWSIEDEFLKKGERGSYG